MAPTSRRQTFEPLGLVAGLVDEPGMGDVLEQATQQTPARRALTVGEAVKAMGRNGLGLINQTRALVPRCFQHKPTSRLMAPRVRPAPLNDEALGRAWAPLYDEGVTARSRLMAAPAANRLGCAPTVVPLERTSVHGDGRAHRAEEPAAEVIHSTRGDSREHRPDLHHVRLALRVEHQAGRPVLMPPLRGHSREGKACGHVMQESIAP